MNGVTAREPDDDERVSLAPLDAETALRALLAVKPDTACSNPDCVEGATHTCDECGDDFCEGHLRHPDHTRPA